MKFLRQIFREEPLQLGLLTLPFLVAALAMPYANDRVPMQWGIHGRVNWFAPKWWGLFALPVWIVVVVGVLLLVERADKNRPGANAKELSPHGKAVRRIRFAVCLFMIGVFFVQVAAALGRHPDVMRLIPAAMGLLTAFMGNFFGKLKPNRYVGFRVPWTLNSINVWRRTHRMAGYLWTAGGAALAIFSLFGPAPYVLPVFVAGLIGLTIVPMLVAWDAARAERQTKSPG
jgi:uncharacterized membrane protein